jgi:hypothetical protein
LLATLRVVDLTDKADQEKGIQWWEELTGSGGEGMVVKPLEFVTKGRKGLAQPAAEGYNNGSARNQLFFGMDVDLQILRADVLVRCSRHTSWKFRRLISCGTFLGAELPLRSS